MKRLRTLGLMMVIGVAGLASANEVKAATYYSAPAGSGSTCSITAACSLTTGLSKLVAGDTLYLRQGSYNQSVSFSQSGTSSAWITISGYPGETAAIDGNYSIPTTLYDFLVVIRGSYVRVQNLEVTRSKQDAMMITGNYSQAVNVAVHDNYASGLIMVGSYNVADRVNIYNNSQDYAGCAFKSGYTRWGAALSCGPGSKYGTIKNSVVHNNWGEGISAYSSGGAIADHCTIQDNISYNNGSVHLYLQNSTNDLVQRNLVYRTADTPLACAANMGLQIGNESTGVCTTGSTIVSNVVMGTWLNFSVDVCTFNGHLTNAVIANNVFMNSYKDPDAPDYVWGNYFRGPNSFDNSIFANNIIIEEGALAPIYVQSSHPGLTFSNNLYNKSYMSSAAGAGDIVADPKLARTGSFTAGNLTADWFRLTSLSPAINKGLSLTQTTTDYYNNARVGATDIGAIEYNGVVPTSGPIPTATTAPPAPTSAPAPTITGSPAVKVIMPLGDSLTYGTGLPSYGGYRIKLYSSLKTYGLNFDFAGTLKSGPSTLPDQDNEGHPGWCVSSVPAYNNYCLNYGIYERVDGWLSTYKPNIILLMIGTGDLSNTTTGSAADTVSRLGLLLDRILADMPNSDLIISTLPPIRSTTVNSFVLQYNAALPNLVATRKAAGKRITMVDAYSALDVNTDVSSDAVHLNQSGYDKLADVWLGGIKALLGSSPVSTPVPTSTTAPNAPTATLVPTGSAPTPTLPVTITCSSFKAATSPVIPALVSAGSQMQISCDYGVSGVSCGMPYYLDNTNTSYSYPCTQTSISGTVVKYSCKAPASLGTFSNACRLIGGGSCQESYCMAGSFKVLTPGDTNSDGVVNNTDMSTWLLNLGKILNTGAGAGDFNGDGVVDGKDYLIWANNA